MKVPLMKIIESLCAARDVADVVMFLGGGRCELDDADRGERWTSMGASLFPSVAFSGNEGE